MKAQAAVAVIGGSGLYELKGVSAAREALTCEMRVLRVGGLQEDLRRSGGNDEDVFRLLHEGFLAQHSPLPLDSLRNASSSPK